MSLRNKYKDLKKKNDILPKVKQNNNEAKISNNSNPFNQIYSVNNNNIYNSQFNNTYKHI